MLKLKTKKDAAGRENHLIHYSSNSRYAESYRTLRANIFFSLIDKDLNSLVVTSTLPDEGKSLTVANLAYTVALAGRSVVMVDADLRKQGLSCSFGFEKAHGLSNILSDLLGRHVNSGKTSEYSLKDLIKLNSLQQRTCVIRVGDGRNEVEFYFLKGEPVDVYWINRPDDQKLATTLVRQNLLREEQVELALGQQKKSVRRLGSVLLSLGLVEEKELKKTLSMRVVEAFRVAMDMGDYIFSVRQMSEDETQLLTNSPINFAKLLSEFFSEDTRSFLKRNIEAHIKATGEKNLYLLPSGNITPNPSELLGSARMGYLLEILKNKFDMVILDSSPVAPTSDALLLAPQVDGVVVVIKAGGTARTLVRETVQQLEKTKANILGILLNKSEMTDTYRNYYSYAHKN